MRPMELARVADLYVRSITNLLRDILTLEQIRGDHEYREHFANRIANDHERPYPPRGPSAQTSVPVSVDFPQLGG